MGESRVGPAATLTPTTSWGSEEPLGGEDDVFARYGPPFDLTADLLFAVALCPTQPLRHAFPGVPFVGLLGRTPLLVWFARVKQGCYFDAAGERRCDGWRGGVLYHELNVLALLRRWALFVPGIYATSPRSVRIGRRYGMPKRAITMSFMVSGRRLSSLTEVGEHRGAIEARLLGSGRALARMMARWWPRRSWPIHFPSGGRVRGTIGAAPSIELARILHGQTCPLPGSAGRSLSCRSLSTPRTSTWSCRRRRSGPLGHRPPHCREALGLTALTASITRELRANRADRDRHGDAGPASHRRVSPLRSAARFQPALQLRGARR